jgi:hypothetical protein
MERTQDVLALTLVALAAGSLLWRMIRSVRGFIGMGRGGAADGASEPNSAGWRGSWASGGCGGGCASCPSNATASSAPATRLITISVQQQPPDDGA